MNGNTMNLIKTGLVAALLATGLSWSLGAHAQEAAIRKNLAERVPQFKNIDEVSKTGIPGLYEMRINGTEIYYTDAQANYLIQGNLIDTKQAPQPDRRAHGQTHRRGL
jgi:thiol:disulfide interchange protein DsbC